MPDITMCNNEKCELRTKCYRFLATPNQYYQSYFLWKENTPVYDCRHFWPVEGVSI